MRFTPVGRTRITPGGLRLAVARRAGGRGRRRAVARPTVRVAGSASCPCGVSARCVLPRGEGVSVHGAASRWAAPGRGRPGRAGWSGLGVRPHFPLCPAGRGRGVSAAVPGAVCSPGARSARCASGRSTRHTTVSVFGCRPGRGAAGGRGERAGVSWVWGPTATTVWTCCRSGGGVPGRRAGGGGPRRPPAMRVAQFCAAACQAGQQVGGAGGALVRGTAAGWRRPGCRGRGARPPPRRPRGAGGVADRGRLLAGAWPSSGVITQYW